MMDTQLGRSVLGRKSCQKNSENCQNKSSQSQPNIRCAVCGHKLVDEEKTEFLNDLISPFAKSVHKMQLFGSENVTVQEFVNPHDYHFHSVQVFFKNTTCTQYAEKTETLGLLQGEKACTRGS